MIVGQRPTRRINVAAGRFLLLNLAVLPPMALLVGLWIAPVRPPLGPMISVVIAMGMLMGLTSGAEGRKIRP